MWQWLLRAMQAGGPRAEWAVRAVAVLIGTATGVAARTGGLSLTVAWVVAPLIALGAAVSLGEVVRRARKGP
jgi:hypothetical protein